MRILAILLVSALVYLAFDLTRSTIPEGQTTPDPVLAFVQGLPVVTLPAEPELAVGGADQSYWNIIWSTRSAALVQDSILVNFDEVRRLIQSYDLNGRHRATWGAEGEGPGEFKDIRSGVGTEGRIWVWDGANWRFSVFDLNGDLETDFSARRLPEIVPGGAIREGQTQCRWFGSSHAQSESDFIGSVPLMGSVVECLPPGQDTLVDVSAVPVGRWMINADGERVPMQMSMERHRRKIIGPDQPMEVPTAPGFDVPPPSDDASSGFSLPIINGTWADPTEVMWTHLAGHIVIYEPDGRPIARLAGVPGRIVGIQRNALLTARDIGDFPLIEVWRFETPLGDGGAGG